MGRKSRKLNKVPVYYSTGGVQGTESASNITLINSNNMYDYYTDFVSNAGPNNNFIQIIEKCHKQGTEYECNNAISW